jgi:hypothetical protein
MRFCLTICAAALLAASALPAKACEDVPAVQASVPVVSATDLSAATAKKPAKKVAKRKKEKVEYMRIAN